MQTGARFGPTEQSRNPDLAPPRPAGALTCIRRGARKSPLIRPAGFAWRSVPRPACRGPHLYPKVRPEIAFDPSRRFCLAFRPESVGGWVVSKQTQPGVPSRGLPGPSLVSEGAPGNGLRSVPQDLPGVPSRCRTPSSLIPGISRFAPGSTKPGLCDSCLVSRIGHYRRASHRASRRPEKKIPAAPPNDHQFYQFHQFHRWGAFSVSGRFFSHFGTLGAF